VVQNYYNIVLMLESPEVLLKYDDSTGTFSAGYMVMPVGVCL